MRRRALSITRGPAGAVGATAGPGGEEPQLALKAAPHVDEEPTEIVRAAFAVGLACNIHYVDFEGLVDGRSMRNIIKNTQPRRASLRLRAGGGPLGLSPPLSRRSWETLPFARMCSFRKSARLLLTTAGVRLGCFR